MLEIPHFGTDGWRGVIAEDFTFAAVRRVSQALALELLDRIAADGDAAGQVPALVVGFDTRFGSARFAAAAGGGPHRAQHPRLPCQESGAVAGGQPRHRRARRARRSGDHRLAQSGALQRDQDQGAGRVTRVGRVPAGARGAARRAGRDGWPPAGRSTVPRTTATWIGSRRWRVTWRRWGTLSISEALRGAGLTVVVDAMYGAGAGILPTLFKEGTTKVIEINGAANPLFPNLRGPEPIRAESGAAHPGGAGWQFLARPGLRRRRRPRRGGGARGPVCQRAEPLRAADPLPPRCPRLERATGQVD